jgi:hypothetical protein
MTLRTLRVTVSIGFALTACGTTTRTVVGAGAPEAVVTAAGDVSVGNAILVNPLDSWFRGPTDDSDRRNREEQLVAACMTKLGLRWIPRVATASEPRDRGGLKAYRQSRGYGIHAAPEPGQVTADTDPNLQEMKSLDETALLRYLDALEGPYGADGRTGGCRGQAAPRTNASANSRQGNPRAIQLWNEMRRSAEHVEAGKAWATCMATAGYSGLVDPEDARFVAGESGSAVTELAMAQADVKCAEATLWRVWHKFGQAAVAELGP